jgi:hypothetical protein
VPKHGVRLLVVYLTAFYELGEIFHVKLDRIMFTNSRSKWFVGSAFNDALLSQMMTSVGLEKAILRYSN